MKKVIAILLTLVIALGAVLMLTSCGTDNGDAETTVSAAENSDATEAEAIVAAETTVEETTAEETTVEETTVEETTVEENKAPESKEEIIEYFNTAVNKVKSDSKGITHNYSKITLNGSTTLPSSLNTILKLLGGADKFLGDQLEKNSKGSETISASGFPVENESWASKLTAADVSSATCTGADGKYTITVKTVADGKSSNVTHGQGHAPKAFNVVLPGIVNDNIPGVAQGIVGTATMNYPSSTAKIVVDAETGNVLSAEYDLCWTINFDKVGAILPFLTSDSYTIAW